MQKQLLIDEKYLVDPTQNIFDLEEGDCIETIFGKMKLEATGYMKSTSHNHKNLHRILFEEFYQIKLPSYIEIHHLDKNRLNNHIWNLIPLTMKEHKRLHRIGENNPLFGKHHSKETLQKIKDSKKDLHIGKGNPNAKYMLWESNLVHYYKNVMFRRGREPNPVKCFALRFNGNTIACGLFVDFTSVELIHKLIMEEFQ